MAKQQFFLFTGDNTYSLTEEVNRWKRAFQERHGEANLEARTSEGMKVLELQDLVASAPFLSEKRLILLEKIPKWSKEEWESLQTCLHPATLVAFIEPSPDKRTSGYRFLQKHADVRTFSPMPKPRLAAWLQEVAAKHGATLDSATANVLIDFVGTDQWHLRNELLKLVAFCSEGELTIAALHAVCLPSGTHAVWTLSDLIGRDKPEEAVLYSRALLKSGEDAFALWNIVLFLVRNIASLWIYLQDHPTQQNTNTIASATGIPFLSVRSLLPLAQSLSPDQIRGIVDGAVDADYALKTGEIRATGEAPIEMQTMVERQLLRCTQHTE